MSGFFLRFYSALSEDTEKQESQQPGLERTARNFTWNVLNGTLSKLAEQLISAGLTLPWILQYLAGPTWLIGALVPIKDGASLLPQLFVSGTIRSFSVRKWIWVLAGLIQGVLFFAAGGLIYFEIAYGAYAIVAFFFLFSVASGLASLAYKDVTARTVPAGKRGSMLSYRAWFGAWLSLPAGLGLLYLFRKGVTAELYTGLFFAAAALWVLAALAFAAIHEEPGQTSARRTAIQEMKAGWVMIREDHGFRRFLFVRSLLFAIPLMLPYLSLLAEGRYMPPAVILAGGAAALLSSPFWGRQADRSSAYLLRLCSFLGLLLALFALALELLQIQGMVFGVLLVFLHGIIYSGTRLARKTYLIDYAPAQDRPTYVAVANTWMGIFALSSFCLGFVAHFLGAAWQMVLFAVMLLLAIILCRGLPEAGQTNSPDKDNGENRSGS